MTELYFLILNALTAFMIKIFHLQVILERTPYEMVREHHANLSKLQEIVENRGVWHAAVYWVAKSWTQLSNLTTTATLWELLKSFLIPLWTDNNK